MKTIDIPQFCKILAHTETVVCDNSQCGEDSAQLMTAIDSKHGHRVWYLLDSGGERTPITGDVKQNCMVLLCLQPTPIKQILGDLNELRLIAKPHELKWVCDRIRDAQRKIERG